jgi:hypothetical protein
MSTPNGNLLVPELRHEISALRQAVLNFRHSLAKWAKSLQQCTAADLIDLRVGK